MQTLLTDQDLPADVLDFIRAEAAVHRRTPTAEVVELLQRLVESRKGRPPTRPLPDPPTTSDEGPPPGDIPLPGPSRAVRPVPGGYFLPDPPVLPGEGRS